MKLAGPNGTWSLAAGSWLIGRGEQCRVLVNDPRLSRAHARLVVDAAGGGVIEDLGSHNGVLVNGDRITRPTALADGDVVVCGPLVLVVDTDPATGTTPEPPRPALYARQRTEEMPPADLMAALASANARRPGSASRPMDPGIAAALGGATDTHVPSTAVADGKPLNALTGHNQPRPGSPRAQNRNPTTSEHLLPNDALMSGLSGSALVPGPQNGPIPPPTPGARLAAGLLDGISALTGVAVLALPLLAAGWVAGVTRAGAGLDLHRLPELVPGGHLAMGEVAASLLRPGGLARAWQLAEALRQFDDRLPFLLVFIGATAAVLATTLVLLLGLVAATVTYGGPAWHQRLHLKVVVAASGHHPGWLRAAWRWLLAALLWPLAIPAVLLGRRAPHDLLSGCLVRRG